MLPDAFAALLAELENDGLPYVLVGGVAVNLLGYERVTGDVAVMVPADAETGRRIRAFLERMEATRPDGTRRASVWPGNQINAVASRPGAAHRPTFSMLLQLFEP